MVRTSLVDGNGMRKGTWSEEEDDKLRAYVQRYGHWNWRQLPKFAGVARCGKSCRLRWMNYLRPGLKHGKYTEEEEDLIVELHEKLGNKWSAIAAKLPGRSDNEIKNYWHANLKKRMKQIPAITATIDVPIEVCGHSEAPIQEEYKHPQISQIAQADENVTPEASGENMQPSTDQSSSEMSSDPNLVTELAINSWKSFSEVESFWREPFLLDTSYKENTQMSSSSVEGEIFASYYSSYLDDNIDFLHQWMEEHPQKNFI